MSPSRNLARGALAMILSSLAFAIMGACIQVCAQTLSNGMVVFFRNLSGLAFLSPILIRGGLQVLRTEHLKEHVFRGLGGLSSMYCFFYAIAHMRLADATLLNYTLPLFIPLVEALWLEEPMAPRLALPLGLGFLGVVVVLRPGSGLMSGAAMFGLLAGFLSAVAQTGVRRLTKTEPTTRIVIYFALMGTSISAFALPFVWVTPAPAVWIIIVLMGLAATTGQLLMTKAYSYAPASQIGGFVYTGVIFAAFLDWMLKGIVPSPFFFAGAALVMAAGALMFRMASQGPVVIDSE
ncbi:MAG: DMT family transporter [Vicinamibacteria bacterium]